VNAVIPVAYAIKRGCNIKASRSDLRLLLIKSLLTGVYGSSGDQVLSAMRKGIQETVKVGGVFELDKFEKKVRLPSGKNIAINMETLDNLLDSTKSPRTFALLSLLTPNLKFNQVQFHQDHIHPHAGFSTSALRKLGIDNDVVWDWQEKRDALPNLHLLEGKENQSKLASPLKVWLMKEYPKTADRKSFLKSRYIPEVSLDLSDFSGFYEQRRSLLKKRLAKLLNVSN
jgi:hypothetical protein